MKRRMRFAVAAEEADVRPTLLGVVTLMFLLLFFLLGTSSGQRLGVVDLRLAKPGEAPPLPHTGLVKDVRVRVAGDDVRVEFEVQSTDIAAASTQRELRAVEVPGGDDGVDLGGVLAAIERIHAIDPAQTRARVLPDAVTTTGTLVSVIDAVRGTEAAPLFPRVVVE